jgi:hypothetical protein
MDLYTAYVSGLTGQYFERNENFGSREAAAYAIGVAQHNRRYPATDGTQDAAALDPIKVSELVAKVEALFS